MMSAEPAKAVDVRAAEARREPAAKTSLPSGLKPGHCQQDIFGPT